MSSLRLGVFVRPSVCLSARLPACLSCACKMLLQRNLGIDSKLTESVVYGDAEDVLRLQHVVATQSMHFKVCWERAVVCGLLLVVPYEEMSLSLPFEEC